MAKTWSDFYPLLAPLVPGCPDVTMDTYLAQSTAEFLMRSHVWREMLIPIDLVAGTNEYWFGSTDGVVEKIVGANVDGHPLERTDVRLLPVDWRSKTAKLPTHFFVKNDEWVVVYPTPTETGTITADAILKTERRATKVEDWIYETWADAIVSGSVARICALPGKEWTDPTMVSFHKAQYERAIHNAKTRDYRGVDLTVKNLPFA